MVTVRRKVSLDELESDILSILDHVIHKNEPVVIERDGSEIALLHPVASEQTRQQAKEQDAANLRASLSAAGGWQGLVDAEALKKRIAAARGSRRSPVML